MQRVNDHLHRLPALSMTLTGGLWFAAGVQPNLPHEIRFALIYVAGWFSLMLIVVMWRLRDVMDSWLIMGRNRRRRDAGDEAVI